jgi:hypothetical protein
MNADGCEAVVRFRAYFYTKVPLRQNVYVCCDTGSPMRNRLSVSNYIMRLTWGVVQ